MYQQKFKDKTSLYEYFEEQGSTEKNNCPDFYDKCKDYNSKIVLPNLLCHNDMVLQKAYAVAKAAKRNRPMNMPSRKNQESTFYIPPSFPKPEAGSNISTT